MKEYEFYMGNLGKAEKGGLADASNCCCNGNFWFIVSVKEFDLIFQIINNAGWIEAYRELFADYSVVSLHLPNSIQNTLVNITKSMKGNVSRKEKN